jgi:hypothetical protein
MADRNVSVRIQAIGGEKVKAEFAQIGRTGTQSLKSIEQASNSMRFGMQNAAYQVGDFFVQVNGGTSAVRALGQQLPQLLGSFGLFGALAGAAFAALAPLVGKMFEGGETADTLAKSYEEMAKATDKAQQSTKLAQTPLAELTKQYGDLADEIDRARKSRAELDQAESGKSIDASSRGLARGFLGDGLANASAAGVGAIGDDLQALIDQTDILRDKLSEVARLSPEEAGLVKQIEINQGYIDTLTGVANSVDELAQKYRITGDEAERLVQAGIALRDAEGAKNEAIAADEWRQALVEVFGSSEDVKNVLPDILSGLNNIVDAAGGLASSMGISADEAARLAANVNAAIDRAVAYKVATGPGANLRGLDDERGSQAGVRRDAASYNTQQILSGLGLTSSGGVKTSGRGGGGGGAGGAQRQQNEAMREAERIFDQTRTAGEKYSVEMDRLTELLKGGYLSQDTFNRAVDELDKKFKQAGDSAQDLGRKAGEALGDIIARGGDAREVIANLLSDIAGSLFSSGWNSIISSIFPSAKGNVFSDGHIVPFARGGVVGQSTYFPMRGGVGLMGEAGPEAIMPLSRGPDGSLGVRAANGNNGGTSVSVHVTVDARGATEGTAEMVARAVRAQVPEIVKQAVAGVAGARKRGRAV